VREARPAATADTRVQLENRVISFLISQGQFIVRGNGDGIDGDRTAIAPGEVADGGGAILAGGQLPALKIVEQGGIGGIGVGFSGHRLGVSAIGLGQGGGIVSRETISEGEQGSVTAPGRQVCRLQIIEIKGKLFGAAGPGVGQFAGEGLGAEQYIGHAASLSAGQPGGYHRVGDTKLVGDDDGAAGDDNNNQLLTALAHIGDESAVAARDG